MPATRRFHRAIAFTLIELLTVMTVIAVLGGIGAGAVNGIVRRSLMDRARSELAALSNALEDYRRHFGDYPQLADFVHAGVAPASGESGPGLETVEAKLFNCLTGVFGPLAFGNDDRLDGPNFLQGSRLLEARSSGTNGTLIASFLVPTPGASRPWSKPEQNASLTDPWGQRYLYYYRSVRHPAKWKAPGYILYSVGADGRHVAPEPATGLHGPGQFSAPENADNLYANR